MAVALGTGDCLISKFDIRGDPTTVGPRWEKWKRSYKLYSVGHGVKSKAQNRALMLSLAGEDVQELFYTLPDIGNDDDFEAAEKALEKITVLQIN